MAGYLCHCGAATWNGAPGFCCLDHQHSHPSWITTANQGGNVPGNAGPPPAVLPAPALAPAAAPILGRQTGLDDAPNAPAPAPDPIFRCWCWHKTWDNKPGYCCSQHASEFPQWGPPPGDDWYRTYLNDDGRGMIEDRRPCKNLCGRAQARDSDVCCPNCRKGGGPGDHDPVLCTEEWLLVRANGGYCKLPYTANNTVNNIHYTGGSHRCALPGCDDNTWDGNPGYCTRAHEQEHRRLQA